MHEVEPFMEWAVETVLPREVRKLTSAIEEKDAALAHRDNQMVALEFTNEEERQPHRQAIEEKDATLAFDLQGRDNQIQAIQYENVALQAQKDVYQAQLQRCKRHHHPSYLMIMREIPVKTKLSSLYGNTQRLPKISFMIFHIMS